MICGVFTIPQGYKVSLNFPFEIHTRHPSNFSLSQLPASFGLPLGSSLFLTLQLWYNPKSTLHSTETSAFSKSWENVVEWRLERGSTNFTACNISLQKFAPSPPFLSPPHPFTPSQPQRSAPYIELIILSTPIITAPSASLFASSPSIKLILLHHQLALHCLQHIHTAPSLHLSIVSFCI
jgi:hypothetical protein